jgi:hypothetical protein
MRPLPGRSGGYAEMIQEVTKESRQADKYISDLVGAISDPIIYHATQDPYCPDNVREMIRMSRLIELLAASKENREPTGTDAECSWYLSTASLEAPFDHEWTTIYQYCFTHSYLAFRGKEVNDPTLEELRVDELSPYMMGKLKHLKAWIYRKRCENRKFEEKEERRKVKEEVKNQKKEVLKTQPSLFGF